MRIVSARLHPFALPLRSTWRSVAGSMEERRGWLIEIVDDEGRCGWGECSPLPSHGSEDCATAESVLSQWCANTPAHDVEDALAGLPPTPHVAPAARAAIECALLDLQTQATGYPLARKLSPTATSSIAVNAAAGTLAHIAPSDLETLAERGFRVIKIKLGLADPDAEFAALRNLCRQLPNDTCLRLDANAGWDMATARRFCRASAAFPIESLEEPLRAPTLANLRELQDECAFPIAIDENWSTLDHHDFLSAPPVRRLTLKLAAAGGLLPALATAQQARAAGVTCVVTTGVDGACGTLAAAHLAASLTGADGDDRPAHGLATSHWLERNNGIAPEISDGHLRLAARPGLGFVPQ